MKNILVSGASGIIGYGILRSLKKSEKKIHLIATTIYENSAAEGFCDVFEKAPLTSDSCYIDWLLSIIKKHQIDLIIPGIEADMYKWDEHSAEIEKSGVKIVLNNKTLISLCNDKWVFYEELNKNNSPYKIETTLVSDFDFLVDKFGLPFLLKPRFGHGSKGIVRIQNSEDFCKHQQDIGVKLMVQPIVGNDNEEYTTSAFCDGKGSFFANMTLRRTLSKQGFTENAEVVNIDGIEDALRNLCDVFKPIGPTNFQFRMHNRGLKLLEINPRISSSTSIRTAFGYNEAEMAVDCFLENKIPTQPLIKQGKSVRYTEDLIFYL